jgi:hypothetical protein
VRMTGLEQQPLGRHDLDDSERWRFGTGAIHLPALKAPGQRGLRRVTGR